IRFFDYFFISFFFWLRSFIYSFFTCFRYRFLFLSVLLITTIVFTLNVKFIARNFFFYISFTFKPTSLINLKYIKSLILSFKRKCYHFVLIKSIKFTCKN